MSWGRAGSSTFHRTSPLVEAAARMRPSGENASPHSAPGEPRAVGARQYPAAREQTFERTPPGHRGGALDSRTPIADVLRKVIALGGRYHSPELRDWASRELNGYGPDDELPDYRKLSAPLQIDALLPSGGRWKGRPVSVYELPEFCRDTLSQGIQLVNGIAEIERMAAKDNALQLQASIMPDLVAYMNSSGKYEAQIIRLFWSRRPDGSGGRRRPRAHRPYRPRR